MNIQDIAHFQIRSNIVHHLAKLEGTLYDDIQDNSNIDVIRNINKNMRNLIINTTDQIQQPNMFYLEIQYY